MKCNLDCSYCDTGIYGGHDNSQPHPNYNQCVDAIDFMFDYVDTVMRHRRPSLRTVVLNVYGGESLNHPNIIEILQAVRSKYRSRAPNWKLHVTTTTNLIVSQRKLLDIAKCVDEFTVSYHTQNSPKQKQLFRENILLLQKLAKPTKCVILMHSDSELFADAQDQIDWCQQHSIKHLPRQLDSHVKKSDFSYNQSQVKWFKNLYLTRSMRADTVKIPDQSRINLSSVGRACCGGRQLCKDSNYKVRDFYVHNKFPGWYCSVDKFFLYVKQVTGEVFVNKDCKMNYQGQVGPIGTLDQSDKILQQLQSGPPVIQCAKSHCFCGLCAPKAKELDSLTKIMQKYTS